jgi:hypothetical protein
MNLARSIALTVTVLSLFSVSTSAQSGFGGRPTVGIFGGASLPSGDLGDEAGIGGHAGALASIRLYRMLDLRVDGAWMKFAEKEVDRSPTFYHTYASVVFGTVDAVLNLGPDSSAYPGDRSVSPYLLAGGGAYKLDYDEECSGNCTGFVQLEPRTKFGLNVGIGSNATFGWLHPFVEGRYHRMSSMTDTGDSRSMFTVSAGLRFR